MATANFLAASANPTTPFTDARYLEKDYAIRRNVTKAMIDVSNPETTTNAGVFTNGAVLNNLVSGGSAATVVGPGSGTAFAPVVTGTLRTAGAYNFAGITLPGDGAFYIPATETKVLVTTYLRMPKSGWPNGVFCSVMGAGTGSGANTQWVMWMLDSTGDGVIDSVSLILRTPAGVSLTATLTGAGLDLLCDGNLHQVGLYMSRVGDVGQCSIYVDQVLRVSSPTSAMTAFNRPSGSAASAFGGPGVGGIINPSATIGAQDTRMGRFGVHYLTNSNLTVAEILADEAKAAALGSLA